MTTATKTPSLTGFWLITPSIEARLRTSESGEILALVSRFQRGDWGDLTEEDQRANDEAILDGSHIIASYKLAGGKVWIVSDGVADPTEPRFFLICHPEER